jgi:uncharacterized protein (DUF58 family)
VNLSPLAVVIVGAAVLLGILGQWSEAFGAFLLWRAVVGVLVLALAYEFVVVRRVRTEARLAGGERLYLGRTETLTLEFENAAPRPLTIRFSPVLPVGLSGAAATSMLSLDPGATTATTFDVRPIALGTHVWPALPVRIRGPLRLAWWSRSMSPTRDVRVLPDTLGARAVLAASAELGATTQARLGGARDLHHLRNYRAGDPRHTIDWKATARASRLITRVFSEDQHLEVMILVDAGRTGRTQIDGMSQLAHYVNLAARFAEYCVAGDDQVGLVIFADRPLTTIAPGRGTAAVTRIRNALAGIETRAVESDVLSAAAHVRRLVRHRCLVLILTDLYERSATGQLAQSARLLARKHLPMIVGLLSEEVVALSNAPAEDWLDPYRSLAAREYRRDVGANVARLAQLGAFAVTARPAELDRKVLGNYSLLRAQRRI